MKIYVVTVDGKFYGAATTRPEAEQIKLEADEVARGGGYAGGESRIQTYIMGASKNDQLKARLDNLVADAGAQRVYDALVRGGESERAEYVRAKYLDS